MYLFPIHEYLQHLLGIAIEIKKVIYDTSERLSSSSVEGEFSVTWKMLTEKYKRERKNYGGVT